MKTNILKYTLAIAGILSFSSCAKDFLEQKNTYQISQDNFFDNDEAVSQAVMPLYSYVWYDFNDKFYYGMGDGRANNITAQYSDYLYPYTNFTETGLSIGLTEAWGSLYSVVAQANNTIINIANHSSANVSETAKLQGIAEARFMRGLAYWYISSLWGCAVIYNDTQSLVNNYVVSPNPGIDGIEYAIRDMEYAAVHLPAASPATGRINKYAAYAMLSRFYLSMAGLTTSGRYDGTNVATDKNRGTRNEYYLDAAKKAAALVIEQGPYQLADTYAELFAAFTFNNNSESIFQLQFQAGAEGGLAQSMTRFLAWSTQVNQGNSWGGSTFCSYDLWEEFKEYEDPTLGTKIDDAIRRHNCVASYGETYPELSANPEKPYIYGETESPGDQGANIKKYVIGTNAVNGFAMNNNSGINTYMMRLAEVYLNYAEAVLGNNATTTDATALKYINELRTRAGVPTKNSLTFEDIRHEFRLETAFEGLYWYFLVRRGYYQQQEMVNYVNNQYRNASYFNLKKVGDTFINMEAFGKGQVYVNGHALGRFWQIGPQQTLYLPGCWLKKGKNEVIVLDVVGPKGEAGKPGSTVAPTAFCQDHPELDKLNLEKSNKHNEPGHRMDLNSETPVLKGEFKAGNGWQTIKLDKPVTGRYFAIQAESSQSGDSQIAIAEVYLQDAQGNRIDRNNWVAYYADSEKGNSTLDKMFDLQESTYWQTEKGANFPHLGIVDMGKEVTISAFEYLPRAEQGAPGSVKGFKLYVRK